MHEGAETADWAAFTEQWGPLVLGRRNFNKIFCIGYNKTGTTTLETVLSRYGYHLPDQQVQEARISEPCQRGDYREFQRFIEAYDAFQDQPFSVGDVYIAADALFPDSRFILTVRDADAWFASMERFYKGPLERARHKEGLEGLSLHEILQRAGYLFPGYLHRWQRRWLTTVEHGEVRVRWDLFFDRDYYIREYRARNDRIRRYFHGAPHKLLVLDLAQEDSTRRLCEFLNIPPQLAFTMPVINRYDTGEMDTADRSDQ
jgi:hypothetical protein